ncbi:hypothetical protein RRF57_010664 [Xylaria bambusicola]|uniref:Uncharacterized protein n=1 Tax=Xylaria bambusicola TaxID=326684 RepID=A0AAN7Z8R5_9PEZI
MASFGASIATVLSDSTNPLVKLEGIFRALIGTWTVGELYQLANPSLPHPAVNVILAIVLSTASGAADQSTDTSTRVSVPFPGPTAPVFCDSFTHEMSVLAVHSQSLVPRENTSNHRVDGPYGSRGGRTRLNCRTPHSIKPTYDQACASIYRLEDCPISPTDVHLVNDSPSQDRVQNHFEERRLIRLSKLVIDSLCIVHQGLPLLNYGVSFVVVHHGVNVRLDKLEFPSGCIHTKFRHDIRDFDYLLWPEFPRRPRSGPIAHVAYSPLLNVTPHLRDIHGLGIQHALDDVSLTLNHSFKQSDNSIDTKSSNSRIPSPPHTHRKQAIISIRLRPLRAVDEVLINSPVILLVRPRSKTFINIKRPKLVLRAHHRLRMRAPQHNLPRIRQWLIRGIIDLEHRPPYRGPQVIRAQAE